MFLPRIFGMFAAVWGVGGAITLLGLAVVRMFSHCIEATHYPLNTVHWVALVAWTFFMAYSEGYRGFQRGYSPRVAARALYLRDHSTLLRLALAPLFCMGFFHAPLRRRITVIVLVIGDFAAGSTVSPTATALAGRFRLWRGCWPNMGNRGYAYLFLQVHPCQRCTNQRGSSRADRDSRSKN